MRVFLLVFGVGVVLVMLIAGKRGDLSRRSPIEIFPDMDRQLKLRPQTPNSFFPNGLSSQLPPPGTVAQTGPMRVAGREVYPHQDDPVNTGRLPGTTNFVELNPLPVTAQLLARGRERYTIYCAPCHGATGDGNGITKKIGAMAVVASLHDKRIVELPDGDIFNTITHGKNLMGAYGPQIPIEDRWAIVAYVRALQLSRLGSVEDLPADLRAKLK
ncbi:MAG: cytochrome c [Verrucomicrobiae bacterium]|nr:cytochrome c [Verrucomicrobiae bacterium]MDW8310859.1 cytochrome c [Verrucomicrobiales bacterium]